MSAIDPSAASPDLRARLRSDLRGIARAAARAWDRLWFSEFNAFSLGVFRIAFGLVWLDILLSSYPNWQRFYGPQGIVPLDQLSEPFFAGGRFSIFAYTRDAFSTQAVYWLALAAVLGFILGWRTRWWTILLYALVISMVNRTPTIVHGEDLVSHMLLFFGCFAPLGDSLSIDSWLRRRKARARGEPDRPRTHPVWSLRLMQISLAFIYVFSLPAKPLDDPAWIDGSAIYYVMVSANWGKIPALAPLFYGGGLSRALTYFTLLVEGAFVLLVWFPRFRKYALAAIVGLHLSLAVLVGHVFNFNLVMLAAFILFVPGESMERALAWGREAFGRWLTARQPIAQGIPASAPSTPGDPVPAPPLAAPQNLPAAQVPVRRSLPPLIIVGLAVLFNLLLLAPEIEPVADANDNVLHTGLLRRAAEALVGGEDATDPWIGYYEMGYPLFHYYQHLPYDTLAALYHLLGQKVSLYVLLKSSMVLLISLLPVSIYLAMRKIGFDPWPAALGGAASTLIANNGLFGWDYGSYIWRGFGLYTQVWGMFFMPLALAWGYHALRGGRDYWKAAALLVVTTLAHIIYGYMLALTLAMIVFLIPERSEILRRLGRLALIFAPAGVALAYFIVPALLDRAYVNQSVWDAGLKFDSLGAKQILSTLFKGDFFDYGRAPVLTLLFAAGLLIALHYRADEKYRLLVVTFTMWLLLYFGRATWGALMDVIPLTRGLYQHRFIGEVQMAAIMLIGVALAFPLRLSLEGKLVPATLAVGLALVVLFPAARERYDYLSQNIQWMQNQREASANEEANLARLQNAIRALPPGRFYAGLPNDWGYKYRVGVIPMYAWLGYSGYDHLGYEYFPFSLNGDLNYVFNADYWPHYDLFNIRYLLMPPDHQPPPFASFVLQSGNHMLYQVQTTGYFKPVRAPFVWYGQPVDWFNAQRAWMESGLLEDGQHPIIRFSARSVEAASLPIMPLAEAASQNLAQYVQHLPAPGTMTNEIVGPGDFQGHVQMSEAGYVLLKVSYHPNWTATVDGHPAPVEMLAPSYPAVWVEADEHDIRMTYKSPAGRTWMMFLGWLGLIATWAAERFYRPQLTTLGARMLAVASPLVVGGGHKALRYGAFAQEHIAPHFKPILFLTALAIVAGLPLFQFKLIQAHDTLAYSRALVVFFEAIQNGQWIPEWAARLGGGYGQPFFIFRLPLFHYLSAGFMALGAPVATAMSLAAFVLLEAAALATYFFVADWLDRRAAIVAAVAYLFAPYLFVNLYVRQALYDFTGMTVLPIAFWAVSRCVKRGGFGAIAIAAFAMGLVCTSSFPTMVMGIPALAVFVVATAARTSEVFQDFGSMVRRGGLAVLLGLGLTAAFWLPAALERNYVHLDRLKEGYFAYYNHFLYPQQLFYHPWGYGLSVAGPNDGISYMLGPAHWILIGLGLWAAGRAIFRRDAPFFVWRTTFLLLLLASLFLTTFLAAPVYRVIPLLQQLLFPSRFMTLAAWAAAALIALAVYEWERRAVLAPGRATAWAVGALITQGLLVGQVQGYANPQEVVTPNQIEANYLSATSIEEYEPVGVVQRPAKPRQGRLRVIAGEAHVLAGRETYTDYHYRVNVIERTRLGINVLYYPGWEVLVDGQIAPFGIRGGSGIIETILDPGMHEVEVRFRDTPDRIAAKAISAVSLAALVVFLWRKRIA